MAGTAATKGGNPLLFTDAIAASVVNKRLAPFRVTGLFTGALFQISAIAAVGLTALSVRIYGSIDGINFPPVNVPSEALVSTGVLLTAGTSVLRQASVLTSDAGAPQVPQSLPPFLLCEYTATIVTSFQLEIGAQFFNGQSVTNT